MNEASPGFWSERYASGETPWLMDRIPAALDSFLCRTAPGRVLIPGCGSDSEVIRAFFAAGFTVTAIDFSQVAVDRIKAALGQ